MSGPRLRHLPTPEGFAGPGRAAGPERRGGWPRPAGPGYWARDADVVVVGSGAAGMSAALAAAGHGLRVLLVSKEEVGAGATPLAQGGLAAALGPGDSVALHQQDTVQAGAGLCDPGAVAILVTEAPGGDRPAGCPGRPAGPRHAAPGRRAQPEPDRARRRRRGRGRGAPGAPRCLLRSPVDMLTRCAAWTC